MVLASLFGKREQQVLLHPTNSRSTTTTCTTTALPTGTYEPISAPPTPLPAKRPLLPQRPSLPRSLPSLSLSTSATPTPTPTPPQPTKPEIRVISAREYAELFKKEQDREFELATLFPWLHGGAELAGAASNYFGGKRSTPSYTGLTTMHVASCLTPPRPLTNSNNSPRSSHCGPKSSFSIYSSSDDSSSIRSFSSSFSSSSSSDDHHLHRSHHAEPSCHSLLVSSHHPSLIISSSDRFNHPALPAHVDLRRFNIQPAKYASISDIVVYGPDGLTEEVLALAERVAKAIEYERAKRVRGAMGVGAAEGYKVMVVGEPFTVFEKEFEKLVSIGSRGEVRNRLNWSAREREEMRVLGEESEIIDGVMLGNSQDVPVPPTPSKRSSGHYYQSSSTSSTTTLSLSANPSNPQNYAIAVECIDNGRMPDPRALRLISENLDERDMDFHRQEKELKGATVVLSGGDADGDESFYDAYTGQEATSLDGIGEEVPVPAEQVVHLECLSTCGHLQTNAAIVAFVNNLVSFAAWLLQQQQIQKRRILIHCGDGYTDSSLLGLTMIMLERRCPLAEAYLILQMDKQRSFFVAPHDVELLLRVEHRCKSVVDRWEEERLCAKLATKMQVDSAATGEPMERSDSGFVEMPSSLSSDSKDKSASVEKAKEKVLMGMVKGGGDEWIDEEAEAPREMGVTTPIEHPWFFGETWEGSFPSRILDSLYLGNLAHASNALMLKELGITHVVSMGESALQPPRQPPFYATARAHMPTNSLWLEQRLGQISVLDMKDVNDDGIDGIRCHFDNALQFIDEAIRGGGKVLVHCRVGVSRSATIVIAYLMKMLSLDLASAYLLTRARRLNILIQPNLPFLATLHAFEAELLHEKDRQLELKQEVRKASEMDDGTAGLKWSNRLAWSYISNEISVLNERFVQW